MSPASGPAASPAAGSGCRPRSGRPPEPAPQPATRPRPRPRASPPADGGICRSPARRPRGWEEDLAGVRQARWNRLPAVMREGLVGLRHAVDVVIALVRAALLGLSVQQLVGEPLRHGL